MKNVPFQDDGPVPVNYVDFQDFTKYCEAECPSFDGLYHQAICERRSKGFRRLCLRTLLRQVSIHGYRQCPYDTTHQLNRLFHIGGGEKRSELYWELHNHPTLANMIIAELLYNLDHGYYGPRVRAANRDVVYPLVLFLIPLSDEEFATEKLWKYHPLSKNPTSTIAAGIGEASYWHQTLEAWAFQKNLPQWIRDELWAAIVSGVQAEADTLKQINKPGKPIGLYWQNTPHATEYPHLTALCDFISHEANPAKTDPSIAEAFLTLIEDILPEEVAYLPAQTRLGCLKYAESFPHNDSLTLKIMQRHLMKFDLGAAHVDGFRFLAKHVNILYGVLGRAYFNEPLDSDFLKYVTKLVEIARNHLNYK